MRTTFGRFSTGSVSAWPAESWAPPASTMTAGPVAELTPRRPSPAIASTANTATTSARTRDRDTVPRLPAPAGHPQSGEELDALGRAAPAERHSSPAVAIAVHHGSDPLQPHLRSAGP